MYTCINVCIYVYTYVRDTNTTPNTNYYSRKMIWAPRTPRYYSPAPSVIIAPLAGPLGGQITKNQKTREPKHKRRRRRRGKEREKEEGGYQGTRLPGVPPIPSTQLPIQNGVSAPTAAGGGAFFGPLFV